MLSTLYVYNMQKGYLQVKYGLNSAQWIWFLTHSMVTTFYLCDLLQLHVLT